MVLAHDISKGDRTKDIKITQNITFETMFLAPNTLKGLKDAGFHKPSPIQLYGIPIGKCGFDLLLEAKSGTGKTAVFTIIALEKLDFSQGLQVVILTPTREIAAQIWDVLTQIGSSYKELRVEVVIGGLSVQNDIEKFKKPVHIVVGSPGRLKQLIQYNHIDTKTVRLLVLDEADKLMDYSFYSDIKYIYTALPQQKQVIMSSATYPEKSRDIINSYVQNASHVCPANGDSILLGIDQKVLFVKYNANIIRHTEDRFKELHKILVRLQFKQCLVFCNYQARVEEVHKLLVKAEWPSQKLHGQQDQVDRLDALKTLQQYKCRILVSTDLAARGIDASNIDLVINFEPPFNWQNYLHRIGRAGRFGSYGLAITILSEGKETINFKKIFNSLALSFNMRQLWSDKEFFVDSISSPITPTDLCIPINSSTNTDLLEKTPESIWELLSCKSKTDDSTNTFKLQCELKEDSGIPKIEPFSELMFSFKDKNCQDNVDDIVFKHMEIHRTYTNKLMSVDHHKIDHIKGQGPVVKGQSQITKEYNNYNTAKKDLQGLLPNANLISVDSQHTIGEDAVIKKASEINKENDCYSESNEDLKEILSNDKLISVDSQNTIGEDVVTMKLSEMDKEDNVNDSESDKELNELLSDVSVNIKNVTTHNNKIYGTNKNFVNSELPTNLFLKSKFTFHDTKRKINLIPDINVEPKKVNYYIENTTQYRDDDHLNDETNNMYEKEYRYNYSQQPNYARSHNNMRKCSSQNLINQNINVKLYNDWYNELKMRMKHIEQAIYIDEMSKF